MSDPAESGMHRVVLAPDLLVRSFFEPEALQVLERWRDGSIQVAVHRLLLVRYLRALHDLGVPERVLRWWSWWFLRRPGANWIEEELSSELDGKRLCLEVARCSGAAWVVSGSSEAGAVASEPVRWVSAREFLASGCSMSDTR